MPEYELTTFAEDDLKSIARYTIDTWGLEQAKCYEAFLVKGFRQIAQNRITARVFLSHRPDLLFTHCEQHYIFYSLRETQCPLIIAIFHERMDLMQRLKNRLA